MARQLVFTSAPQGLTPGRTGYCTVARHGDLRERLVPVLEGLSVFPSDWDPAPVICSFRLVEVGGSRFPVLSRIVNAGHDYTHRTHFLAHHLILEPDEMAGVPPPAEIFLRWSGWLNRWEGSPRWLDTADLVNLATLPPVPTPPLPARVWGVITGDAGSAALLVDGSLPASRMLRADLSQENEVIHLLRESSALLLPSECWRAEFTTCLQPSESPGAFRWVGTRAESPADLLVARPGTLLDLTQPASLPAAPATPAARLARDGPLRALGGSPIAKPMASSQPISLTKSSKADAPSPGHIYTRPSPVPAAPSKKIPALILSVAAGLIIGTAAALIFFWPHKKAPAPAPAANIPAVAPLPVFTREAITQPNPRTIASPSTTSVAPATNVAITNEQVLMDIEQLAGSGKFLEALDHWRVFAKNAPDFAQSHIDVLKARLLPGARKEWLTALDKILIQLAAGTAQRAELLAQLDTLREFPRSWPVTNPKELNSAADSVAVMLKFLGQLPDAPVWIVDNLAATSTGSDFQDASASLSIPELSNIMKAGAGKFHVSAAPATSMQIPAKEQWFDFEVRAADFSRGDFLILHDISRGEAGGRFLQLLVEPSGKTRLTWRLFQPQSDIFQRFPPNSPLRPLSRLMWLHFAGDAPLPSFYLLLRRPDNVSALAWKPLALPINWLGATGAPAQVTLPAWLSNNLHWHTLPGQSFHLEPTLLDPVVSALASTGAKLADSPAAVQYQAADLVDQLNEKVRAQQTDLARAQQQWTTLQAAPDRRAAQAAIDQAAETVKNLQHDIAQAQAAAQTINREDWPRLAAPWMFYDTLASKDTLIIFQFTPHEAGPTP